MRAPAAGEALGRDRAAGPASPAVGFLALVPLLAAYELALPGLRGLRSTAELVVLALPERAGLAGAPLRVGAIGALALASAVLVARRGRGLVPGVLATFLEGAIGGLVLGPVLVGLLHLMRGVVALPVLAGMPEQVPAPSRAAFVLGAAAWDELLFRAAAYGLLFLLARRLVAFFGLGPRPARVAAELTGLVGSATLFAAAHLERFTAWLGTGGERFDPSSFAWRWTAGILLGVLFRWRGLGVAAWSHALFDLALLLGAGPDVFLGGP